MPSITSSRLMSSTLQSWGMNFSSDIYQIWEEGRGSKQNSNGGGNSELVECQLFPVDFILFLMFGLIILLFRWYVCNNYFTKCKRKESTDSTWYYVDWFCCFYICFWFEWKDLFSIFTTLAIPMEYHLPCQQMFHPTKLEVTHLCFSSKSYLRKQKRCPFFEIKPWFPNISCFPIFFLDALHFCNSWYLVSPIVKRFCHP